MQKDSIARWGALIAIVIALGLGVANFVATSNLTATLKVGNGFGAITTGTNFPHGISVGNPSTIGAVPTNISHLLVSSCSLIAASFTVAASTTVAMDCAVTGALSTDIVQMWFGTSTVAAATTAGWRILGSQASSTNGFISLQVRNDTGASAILPSVLASSTYYEAIGIQ